MTKPAENDFIVEDDASKILASEPASERRPKYGLNGLPKTCGSFSKEEEELVFDSILPKPK